MELFIESWCVYIYCFQLKITRVSWFLFLLFNLNVTVDLKKLDTPLLLPWLLLLLRNVSSRSRLNTGRDGGKPFWLRKPLNQITFYWQMRVSKSCLALFSYFFCVFWLEYFISVGCNENLDIIILCDIFSWIFTAKFIPKIAIVCLFTEVECTLSNFHAEGHFFSFFSVVDQC